MKGKIKFSLNLIFAVAILVCATLCFALTKTSSKKGEELFVHAVATLDNKEYSALLDGDVVFSVEKVSVPHETLDNYTGWNMFYKRTTSGEQPVYFKDITDNGKTKQVVEDGQFVMLNNQNISNKFINPKTSQTDAIMISLGQYVYRDGKINYAPAISTDDDQHSVTEYAQLSYVDVTIKQNGVKRDDLAYRNIITSGGELYFDFVYVIQENVENDIEGHYEIEFEYMVGGEKYSSNFDFYLVCETSYTKTTTVDGQTYTAYPKLGWTKDGDYIEAGTESGGIVHYYEGVDGLNYSAENTSNNLANYISYPTITYDYTKYQLSYSLVANRVVTNYNLTYNVKSNTDVEMICASSGLMDDSQSFTLTNYNKDLKLVTVVFTEQGTYNFSFKYLYTGADASLAPSMDKLKIEDKKLAIHGVDLNYSKQGYTQAQFRKFVFATNSSANCNLIIPNGYEQTESESNISKYQNNALGLMYKTDDKGYEIPSGKSIRVGEVILSDSEVENVGRTEDTLQNYRLDKSLDDLATEFAKINRQAVATSQEEPSDPINPVDYIKKLEFVKSNQGSMWLTYADNILETKDGVTVDGTTSFYLFNRNEFLTTGETISSGVKVNPYNNQTSFNKVGYYVVFIKIKPSVGVDFWQVYAFQYMTDTVDIQVKTKETGKTVGAGKYTNENVTVNWKDTATFETKITGYYYKLTNNNADRETLLKSTKYSLTKNTQTLGGDVANNQFAKYLIKLERAGSSATYKMFTIDRQPISGIYAYAIKTRTSNSKTRYEYAVNSNNQAIQIRNGITNSYATLDWNNKDSGAEVNVNYSYTPFIEDNNISPEFVNGKWITTKYTLGTTINNCELSKSISQTNVGYDSIISGQGIYIFTLTDEAGNSIKYMLVIDKTEAYLQVSDGATTEILPNETYRLYGKNITYTTGECKAIKIDTTKIAGSEILSMLNALINNNLANYKDENQVAYYTLDSRENANSMQNLFSSYNGESYITVKNLSVVAYDTNTIDAECSAYNYPPVGQMVYDKDKLNGATSLYRKLYIVSESTRYSAGYTNPNDSNSSVTIEINKDSSLGMVYYSNTEFTIDKLPKTGDSSASIKRLNTGSDNFDTNGNITTSGINGARASKDKYFAFTWLVGADKFAVKKVEYQYYSLNLDSYNWESTDIYFYSPNGELVTIYDSVATETTVVSNGRAFYMFNTDYDNTTKEGLYKITRYYTNESADYGDDSYKLTYYYIVDRNGILDVTNKIGTNISIGLLNGENGLSGNDFNLISSTQYDITVIENDKVEIDDKFYMYFTTNKVPAILNIPTGKYFNKIGDSWESSKNYYAGQLKISVYYKDVYNQINKGDDQWFKLFEKDIADSTDYFNIDFYSFIKERENEETANKFICNSTDGKNWLHLKGWYVVVIEDNVETSSSITNRKLIGFEIKQEEYPNIDVKIGGKEDEVQTVVADNKGQGKYEVMTNQEFVRVELPKYETETKDAQIDDNYISITQYDNGVAKDYFIKNYDKITQISTDVNLTTGDNGIQYLYLDTKLRDDNGNVIKENLSKSLYYTVTVRYKIGNDKNNATKYQNCYSYIDYDNNGVWSNKLYCYATYTIVIDRLAPTQNVEYLIKTDALISKNYATTEFEASVHEESQIYFTYQYKDYYANDKKLSDIYVFRVTDSTLFDTTDVDKIYYSSSAITDLDSLTLSLPINSYGGFNSKDITGIENYGNVLGDSIYGYYQILEEDKAGNITQYVVYYTNREEENITMPITYTSTVGDTVDLDLGAVSSGSTIPMFGLRKNRDVTFSGDRFFYITLKDVNNLTADDWEGLNLTTNLATPKTGDNSLTNEIINAIGNRKGTYELTITPRAGEVYKINLGLYGEEDKVKLNVEKLIMTNNGKYYINLAGANTTKDNNVFYATEIVVVESTGDTTTTNKYVCKVELGKYNYYLEETINGETTYTYVQNALIPCLNNTTYKITITDLFNDKATTMFNTSGKEFYTIKVDNDNFGDFYIDEQGNYYAYSNVIIEFDQMFKISSIVLKINDEPKDDIAGYIQKDETNHRITIKGEYNKTTGVGSVLNVVIKFKENGSETENREFNITIDKSIQNISLKDFTTGNNKETTLYNDVKLSNLQDLTEYKPTKLLSGIMNLSWTRETKQAYVYDYRLYEHKKDGSVAEIDISSVSNKVIDTQDDSLGVYWFVINVYTPDNVLLGNKIYAFEVQQVNNQLYYVKNEQGLAINANSTFVKTDISSLTLNSTLNNSTLNTSSLPTTNMPLYITNQDLDVVLTENVSQTVYTASIGDNTLKVYIIDATTYKLYFGILKVENSTSLVNNINVGGTKIGDSSFYTYADNDKNSQFVFNASDKTSKSGLLAKNILILNVYYNNELVSSNEYNGKIEYTIKGNGSYSFEICDLAGNTHTFDNGTSKVELLILREVVVTLNGQVPIDNGYYNDEVSLKVYASTKYVTGSISVTAKRNGQDYAIKGSSPYVFNDYGTYVVTIRASYKDNLNNTTMVNLTKTVVFTIINSKEVRTSIDLTSLKQYEITKVTNLNGQDITSAFKQMTTADSMLITYEKVMQNKNNLKLSAGKLLFTIDYVVTDNIYPQRNMQIQFTLNDEKPVVNCSLKVGESTTKEFNISFNPGIIFEQIGESYILINGEIVYTINSSSPSEVVEIVRSYKEHGDGDYYITVTGTSGNIWESFKVEIKEPLNTAAIIVIVVIVAVVGTVVVTIIVLRRKMRIR